jgi:TPR repeat protein
MTIAAVLAIGASVYFEQGLKSEEDYQSLKSEEDRAEAQVHFQQAAVICKSLAGGGGMMAVLLSHGAFSEGDQEIAELQRALPHLRIAAENGDKVAQYFVGSVLQRLGRSNKTEAEAFLLRAAKQGHPLASRVLSQEYLLRHPLHTSNRQQVEDGMTWHLITPEKLRNPQITAALLNDNREAMQAARRRAAEFRPLSEYRTERMRQTSERSGKK